MSETKTKKDRIAFRTSPQEYDIIFGHFSKTTSAKLGTYCRNVLLHKPVCVKFRNDAADDLLTQMLILKKELNAIGNNYNQAVHRLHTLDRVSEIKSWLMENECHRLAFMELSTAIFGKMNEVYQLWSSE